jgi:hypothetical protein
MFATAAPIVAKWSDEADEADESAASAVETRSMSAETAGILVRSADR